MRRLEAALLSEAHRGFKRVALLCLLTTLCGWYGLQGGALRQPSLVRALLEPTILSGEPLTFAFAWARVRPGDDGLPVEIETVAGWLPLRRSPLGVPEGVAVSVAGIFHGDGTLTPTQVLVHPDRGSKVWVSLAALVGVFAALLARVALGRRFPPAHAG